jgi:hypothetical protein
VSGDPSHPADRDDQAATPTPADGPAGDGVSGTSGTNGTNDTDGADRTDPDNGSGAEVGALVERLSDDRTVDPASRRRLLRRLAGVLVRRQRKMGVRGALHGATDILVQIAPRIPVRDLETLREHHRGLTGEQLADALTRNAARATAAVGAAGGALAVVDFAAPPLLLTAPAQLIAESLVVAAIEVKLIAELHEVYGVQVPGTFSTRASVFLGAWAKRRGVDPLHPYSMTVALGMAARTALRKRLMRTFGRHLTTLGPFLTGAVAGGALNRAATRRLAEIVHGDLRDAMAGGQARPALPEAPDPPQ